MSLNPLIVLKRRLDDVKTPLPKRLCLAKNVVQSHHFPTAPKERVVAEWLQDLTERNSLKTEDLKNVLDWLTIVDDFTSELKIKLIQIVSLYLQRIPLQNADVQYIISFLENSKISTQLHTQIDDYLTITITLLQHLRNAENGSHLSKRILNNFIKYYRESKKKLDFIIKLLNGENIETVFSFLDSDCRMSAIDVCQTILFPITKKSYFISFLQTLIRKDNLEELIAEKGDNIQSVIKIMNAFFEFPKNRSNTETKFLQNFIDVFVSSFQTENQIVFAFYIMVTNVLQMEQNFITPAMNLTPIALGENNSKVKRSLFLNMLEVLLDNEVDINVRLTDTFGEKISKVEIKKRFTSFLQAVMMNQLKLDGKLDRITIQIIKTALNLDPILVEQKKLTILPAIMTAKKNSSSITESYTEMMKCLLQILFKLSRGTQFITEILPPIKAILEAVNTEQFELKQKVKEAKDSGQDYEKLECKIISGSDVLPQECVDVYGKLTSELMFRQNKELLESLQKDLEVNCLMMLEEGFVSPSIIVLAEVLSAVLSSFMYYNKMAGHTVPLNVAEDFWNAYKRFEGECLNKFGQCVLKLSYNPPLVLSFLKLCQNFAQLKLLNIKYSNVKLEITQSTDTSELFNLSDILPCLDKQQWIELTAKIVDNEAVVVLNNLLLMKTMASQILSLRNGDYNKEIMTSTKAHLIKQVNDNPTLLQNNNFCNVLFSDLDKTHTKQLAKCLIKLHLADPELGMLQSNVVTNNRTLLNFLVMETAKNIAQCFNNEGPLSKMLGKSDFNMASFVKETEIVQYFEQLSIKEENQDEIKSLVNILKQLPLCYLDENYQLVAIFFLLAIKKSTNVKKLKRNIDTILQSIYELSLQQPDLYQIFPIEYIFSFEDNKLLDLLTSKLKNANNLLIIKSLLELAVKKVRNDSDLVKTIVAKLLKKNKKKVSDIESFNDPAFQVTCLILPIIVKQKKKLTASAFRSILADLQEKLHNVLLESFKNIDFNNGSILVDSGNPDDSAVQNDCSVAALNAMPAYSLTLSKYCESTDGEEIKNLDCLWSALEFFTQCAMKSIEDVDSKSSHIEASIQLLNVILRNIKKLETHDIFKKKDKIFIKIYKSIKERLIQEQKNKVLSGSCLEDLSVTLKFVCELSTVEFYSNHFINELTSLVVFKKPSQIDSESNSHYTVFKYIWSQCLKANIVGTKCVAMSKVMNQISRKLMNWIQHYDIEDSVGRQKNIDIRTEDEKVVCENIGVHLDASSDIILAAKKVSLDYKFVDSIFELQHMIHYIIHNRGYIMNEISWNSLCTLYEGCVSVLNSLVVAREEVLEDRWPCYMQCYRALVTSLCERATSQSQFDPHVEEKLAEIAHNIEKLTHSICKRRKQLSGIAAYTVAELCSSLERNGPPKMVRQHLENSVALLIEASDSHAMPFLKRAMAGSPGQVTMNNLVTVYKRYHKYVGNA